MNCQDIREHLLVPSPGRTGLTERALVHAHVAQCADCQAAERAPLQLAVSAGPGVEPSRGAAISHLSGQVRSAIAGAAPPLIWLRATLLSASRGAAHAAREAAGTEATRVLDLLNRFRVLGSRSLTVSGRAAARAIETAWAMLTWLVWRLQTLLVPSARAAVGLVGHARSVSARVPGPLIQLGSALMIARQGAARAANEAAGVVLGFVTRSFRETVGAAGRVVAASRVGAMRTRGVLVRVAGRLPSLLAPSARAIGHIVGTIPDRARAHPRVYTGIVSVVVLVALILLLGPRQWPGNLVPQLSPGEPLLRDVRLPVDREPAEPIAATPLVQIAPPMPDSGPQPIPTPRVAAPETHAAIPAPVRRSGPASESRPSTEVTRNEEPSDPAAAIDWLLKGSGRRNVESP